MPSFTLRSPSVPFRSRWQCITHFPLGRERNSFPSSLAPSFPAPGPISSCTLSSLPFFDGFAPFPYVKRTLRYVQSSDISSTSVQCAYPPFLACCFFLFPFLFFSFPPPPPLLSCPFLFSCLSCPFCFSSLFLVFFVFFLLPPSSIDTVIFPVLFLGFDLISPFQDLLARRTHSLVALFFMLAPFVGP